MLFLLGHGKKTTEIVCSFCIIVTVLLFTLNYISDQSSSLLFSFRFLLIKLNKFPPENNSSTNPSVLPINNRLLNLTFSVNRIYHHDGIAYDYYSKNELGQSKASHQWNIWPLPNQINQTSFIDHIEISPFILSKLPFVDVIYVTTDPRFTERHTNLKKAFQQQGISMESLDWRMKWNRTTCNSNSSHSYIYQRLNLKDKALNEAQQQRCALAMKHVDVWYEMAERKIELGLILEDDAIFVPFFKEKFTRMISKAIQNGILRINGTCVKPKEKSISNDEWINQNPMIVIGTCFNFHGERFEKHLSNASPMFSTHKSDASRCSHAYLLTSCSAQALVDQIQKQKNDFWPSDFLLNHLFRLSLTLQSFWMDPPLVYQGNQVIDLENLSSFKIQTYN